VGTHHDRGGRQALPVRIVRLPGGVRSPPRRSWTGAAKLRWPRTTRVDAAAHIGRPLVALRAPCLPRPRRQGVGIGNLINLFNPERVILAAGLACCSAAG
jgi:hypothetical protein